MTNLSDPLFWIALWGALTGTLAIILTWLSFRQDRPGLVIDSTLSLWTDNPDVPHQWRFEIILRNSGRRPCYVERAGIEVSVASISWNNRAFRTTGPTLIHLFDGGKQGIIRLGESEKRSVVICPFPDVYIDMMRTSNDEKGTLLVINSLGQEFRHKFTLPPDSVVESYRHQRDKSSKFEDSST